MPTVHPISGEPAELLAHVGEVTDGGIYLDGGALIRQFVDSGVVDELTVTLVPCILGAGAPLFAGAARTGLALVRSQAFDDGLVQLTYRLA